MFISYYKWSSHSLKYMGGYAEGVFKYCTILCMDNLRRLCWSLEIQGNQHRPFKKDFFWEKCVQSIHDIPKSSKPAKLLNRFSRVRLCVTPQSAAHQAPLSLGFSRQEHRSGLPFPSPMHESEKWKWSRSVVSDSSQPHGLQPTRLLYPWDFPGKSAGVGCHCLLPFKV